MAHLRCGVLRDADGSWYMREEAGGLISKFLRGWGASLLCRCQLSDDSEYELLQEDRTS